MKKTLAIFLSMAVLVCAVPHMVFAATTTEVDGMTYELNDSDKTATLTKGKDVETVEIPGSVNYNGADYTVTAIGLQAFQYCGNLTSVDIPNSVKSIDYQAFYRCGLTAVTIPGSVTTIANNVFESCESLKSVDIPDSVESIGKQAFYQCYKLESVKIPSNVTAIGNSAFERCSGLTSVEIGSNVTTIGYGAFNSCTNLASVNIPNSVESIDSSAFWGCSKLGSVEIGSGLQTINDSAFRNCENLKSITVDSDNKNFKVEDGVLLSKDDTRLVLCSKDKSGSYGIPNKVKSIDDQAFNYCKNLTSLTFSDSVESIGVYAFNRCSGLTSITIPCDFDKDKFKWTNITVGDGNTFTINVGVGEPKQGSFELSHDWGEWETTKEVTCTTDGEKTRSCQREGCGTPETGSIAATGHKLTKTEKREPTCVAEGMNEYWTCSQCRVLFSDSAGKTGITESDLRLPALGHALELIEEVRATCVATGTKKHYKCSRCGALFSDENGETPVKDEDLTLPELGHNWGSGEVTTPATPEKSGVKTYICSRCGKTKTEPVEYVGIPGGNSNSTNLHQDAERVTIKTGDQMGIWVMFDMALLLMSAYGILVGVGSRRKRYKK